MSITIRHRQTTQHGHTGLWIATGLAAVALTAGTYVGIQAVTGQDNADERPAPTATADPSGLGAVLAVQYPTMPAVVDMTGLTEIFSVPFRDSIAPVDTTGLSQVFGVRFAIPQVPVDPSGLGAALAVDYPTVAP